jgi:hypothetical protein
MGLKEDLSNALTEQISIGKKIEERIQSVSNEEEIDQLTSEFKSWDEVNKQILKNGFVMQQLHAIYSGNASLGNLYENRTFITKRDFLIKSLPVKLNHLKTATAQLAILRNTDLGPINNIELNKPTINISSKHNTMKKLFISHSSKDDKIIAPLLDLINMIGVPHDKIFYCSEEGYGLEPGTDLFYGLKAELNNEVFALFLLSKNFYESQICLCEMGAIWIKSYKQIPIIIPPMSFNEMDGVFPKNIGLTLNNEGNMDTLKDSLEKYFEIPSMGITRWNKVRDKYILEVNALLK